jgi:hypothetical protein
LSHGPSQHRAQAHDPALLHHRLGHDQTLDPVRFAWGEENFGDAGASLDANGFFLFEGEIVATDEVDVPTLQLK